MKAVDTGLEGFVDWANPVPASEETQGAHPIPQITSDLDEESKDDMSSLAIGFVGRMCKRAVSTQRETTLDSEVPDESFKNGLV